MGTRIRRDQIKAADLVNGSVVRDEAGQIEAVDLGDQHISFGRDGNNKITSITLSDRVITLTRVNDKITGWVTTEP